MFFALLGLPLVTFLIPEITEQYKTNFHSLGLHVYFCIQKEIKSKYSRAEYFVVLCLLSSYFSSSQLFQTEGQLTIACRLCSPRCSYPAFCRTFAEREPPLLRVALGMAVSWYSCLNSGMAGAETTSVPGNPQLVTRLGVNAAPDCTDVIFLWSH